MPTAVRAKRLIVTGSNVLGSIGRGDVVRAEPAMVRSGCHATKPTASGPLIIAVLACVLSGCGGGLPATFDNYLAIPFVGPVVYLDSQRNDTELPAVQYAAGAYGAQNVDGTALGFQGRLIAFVGGFMYAGEGTVQATATIDPLDPAVMRGTLTYSTNITFASIPEGNIDGAVSFVGHRVRN